MPEAYVIDVVRTAVGKRNGSLAGVHPVDLGAAAWRGLLDRADVDPGAVDDVIAGCVDAIGGQAGNIARLSWLAAGYPGGGPRRHRRPPVRFEPAGYFLWRTGDHVRHRRSDRGRRHAEHEPDPDLVGDDRRRAVRVHLADQRIQELAAPLRRSGDLAVPRFGVDRREVGHLARGDGAVLADQPPARAGGDPRRVLRERDHPASTASSPTRDRATPRWRRWPA